MRNWLIKLFGGYTIDEYKSLERRYQKIQNESSDDQSIQLCNETTFRNLSALENMMENMYGTSPEIWCEKVYNVVKNNRIRVLVFHLNNMESYEIYRLNINLEYEEKNRFLSLILNLFLLLYLKGYNFNY